VGFYGARNPQDAASVFFQKAEVYEAQNRNDDLRAHLLSYLDRGASRAASPSGAAHFRWRAGLRASCAATRR